MQKIAKNQLIGVIQAAGLSPQQFQTGYENERRADDGEVRREFFALGLRSSPLAFHIGQGPTFAYFRYRWTVFQPGFPTSSWTSGSQTLEQLLKAFSEWIRTAVKPYLAELAEPDLWESYSADTRLMEAGSAIDDNAPLNAAEQVRIAESLAEVRAFLAETHSHSAEEQRFVDERLKYLEEAATRLGRKDWINITAGVLSNIVVGLALSPDAARGLFQIAGQALSWLLDVVRLLP